MFSRFRFKQTFCCVWINMDFVFMSFSLLFCHCITVVFETENKTVNGLFYICMKHFHCCPDSSEPWCTREQGDNMVFKWSSSWNEIVIFSVIVPNYTVISENLQGNCELVVLKWWTCRINSCTHILWSCDFYQNNTWTETRAQWDTGAQANVLGMITVWKCHHDLTDRQLDREWDRNTGTTPHHQLSANGGWKYSECVCVRLVCIMD